MDGSHLTPADLRTLARRTQEAAFELRAEAARTRQLIDEARELLRSMPRGFSLSPARTAPGDVAGDDEAGSGGL